MAKSFFQIQNEQQKRITQEDIDKSTYSWGNYEIPHHDALFSQVCFTNSYTYNQFGFKFRTPIWMNQD